MNYHKKSVPIQKGPDGHVLRLIAHIFTGIKPGPRIYLQGNLHGPELFGAALLTKLVAHLMEGPDFPGTLIIVPCANPMGVNQTAYNAHTGRWNAQSGKNWNRIFSAPARSPEASSIEDKLARALSALSKDAEYVLDIHTTGSKSAEHLFTYPWMTDAFASLGVPYTLLLNPQDVVGAFDESHVVPYLATKRREEIARVATWEAHHHNDLDADLLEVRLAQLIAWITAITKGRGTPAAKAPALFEAYGHLHAPIAGYYSWMKNVGEAIKKGDAYACVYHPDTGKATLATSDKDCVLLSTYGVQATSEGEQIAWLAW